MTQPKTFASLIEAIERQSFCWLLRSRAVTGEDHNPPGPYFAHVHNGYPGTEAYAGAKAWSATPEGALAAAYAAAIDDDLRAPGDPPAPGPAPGGRP